MGELKNAVVGISGGVDSSYTLSLLKSSGWNVTGAYLIMTDDGADTSKAARCAEECGVPFVALDCRKQFAEAVTDPFVFEYTHGRTPNPCVECNRFVKIESLRKYAIENGFSHIATGHYARIQRCANGRYAVGMARDLKKDQSYMLWKLTQEQLSMLVCPLEDAIKTDVRAESAKKGLSASAEKDSLDICFIKDGDYAAYIESRGYSGKEGQFVHADGRIMGKSKSIINYTVGQRRGLGISADRSVFVTSVDSETATVTVDYEEGIYSDSFSVRGINFVASDGKNLPLRALVKIRYAARPVECGIKLNDGASCAVTALRDPFRAVTPGQSAVFYDESGTVLFGGYITKEG